MATPTLQQYYLDAMGNPMGISVPESPQAPPATPLVTASPTYPEPPQFDTNLQNEADRRAAAIRTGSAISGGLAALANLGMTPGTTNQRPWTPDSAADEEAARRIELTPIQRYARERGLHSDKVADIEKRYGLAKLHREEQAAGAALHQAAREADPDDPLAANFRQDLGNTLVAAGMSPEARNAVQQQLEGRSLAEMKNSPFLTKAVDAFMKRKEAETKAQNDIDRTLEQGKTSRAVASISQAGQTRRAQMKIEQEEKALPQELTMDMARELAAHQLKVGGTKTPTPEQIDQKAMNYLTYPDHARRVYANYEKALSEGKGNPDKAVGVSKDTMAKEIGSYNTAMGKDRYLTPRLRFQQKLKEALQANPGAGTGVITGRVPDTVYRLGVELAKSVGANTSELEKGLTTKAYLNNLRDIIQRSRTGAALNLGEQEWYKLLVDARSEADLQASMNAMDEETDAVLQDKERNLSSEAIYKATTERGLEFLSAAGKERFQEAAEEQGYRVGVDETTGHIVVLDQDGNIVKETYVRY